MRGVPVGRIADLNEFVQTSNGGVPFALARQSVDIVTEAAVGSLRTGRYRRFRPITTTDSTQARTTTHVRLSESDLVIHPSSLGK